MTIAKYKECQWRVSDRRVLYRSLFVCLVTAMPAFAQQSTFNGNLAGQIFGTGLDTTSQAIAAEQKLLSHHRIPMTWDHFPLLTFPTKIAQRDGDAKFNAEQQRKLEKKQQQFIDDKLKGRQFSGSVRIRRVAAEGETFKVVAAQASQGKRSIALNHKIYDCVWTTDDKTSFKVGKKVTIVGAISNLKEGEHPAITFVSVRTSSD